MSSGQSQIDAVLETIKDPEVRIPPVYVQTHGENSENESFVVHTVEVPLLFDNKTMNVNATGPGDFPKSREVNAYIFTEQLCLGMMQKSETMGSVHCKFDHKADPKMYWACVTAYTKREIGFKLTASETKLLRVYVSKKHYFDPGFHHDVKELQNKMEAEKKRNNKDGKRKKKKDDDNDGEEGEDLLGENIVPAGGEQQTRAEVARMLVKSKLRDYSNRFLNGREPICFGNHIVIRDQERVIRGPKMNTGNIMETMTDAQLLGQESAMDILLSQAHSVRLAEKEDQNDKEGRVNDEGEYEMVPYEGPRMLEKVSMTVSPVHNAHEELVGCWMRFLIRDPGMNPGAFFMEILQNLDSRKNKKQSPMAKHFEMFPDYMTKFKTMHPFGDHMSLETYRHVVQQVNPALLQNCSDKVLNFVSITDTHFYRLFTVNHAIETFSRAGGVDLGSTQDWFKDNTAYFPLKTWKYRAEQAVWFNSDVIGLSEQDFPFIGSNTKFLQTLITAPNIREFMERRNLGELSEEGQQEVIQNAFDLVDKELGKLLVSRRALKDSNLLGYDTSNQFVISNARSKQVYKRLEQLFPSGAYDTGMEVQNLVKKYGQDHWRDVASEDLLKRVDEYELYCAALKDAQAEMLKDFCQLWNPNASVDDLPISDPIKVMLKWYKKNESMFPNVTRPYHAWDPEMDMFGNTQIQQLHLYVHFARILQPIICMLSEGLFSAYDHDMKELTFNMMIHGRYDTGKTYTAIKTLIDFTAIPGTVSEFSLATKAADVTKKHSYDEIIASDECPEWMVSEEEGKKNQDQVNKEKIKYTRGQITQRTFAYVTMPNGDKVRWNEDIVSDHKKSCVFVTNHAVEAKGPLSSRMFRHTMKQTSVPANEMKGYMAEKINEDTRTWLRLNQYLTCCAKKAAQTGAIFPEVQMDLFDDVANKVFGYLKDWGMISDDAGKRSLDIMRPYARQLIYKMAVRYTFDMPGSKHYKKPFHPSMIQDVQKYLYSTVSIVWWTLTACATEWIDDDDANIIRALIKDAGDVWSPHGENPYEVYINDVHSDVPFKIVDPNGKAATGHGGAAAKKVQVNKNANANDANVQDPPPDISGQTNVEMIHLDYLTSKGTLDQICRRACVYTQPRMGYADFMQGIKRLSERNVNPMGGGFEPQPLVMMEYWHKWKEMPDGNNPNHPMGRKNTCWGCPRSYLTEEEKVNNPDQTINTMRTEEHLKRRGPNALLPVVDLSDMRHNRLYFMPNAVNIFVQDILLDALFASIVCSTMRSGKYLQGFPDQKQPTYMSVTAFTPLDIEEMIEKLDQDNGFSVDARGRSIFVDESVPEELRPISRRQGISFNQRGGLTAREQQLTMAQSWAPTPEGCDDWKELYKTGVKNMSKTSECIADLDYVSALKQAMNTGQPIDAPIEDGKFLQAQYERECRARRIPVDDNLDYPVELLHNRRKLNGVWNMSSGEPANVKKHTGTAMGTVKRVSKLTREERKIEFERRLQERRERAPPPPPRAPPTNTRSQKRHKPMPPRQTYGPASSSRSVQTSVLDY